ncbi:MAG: hypothetical protein C4527_21980 [Candidatus Omnitrophota bacterium]|jgi:hypothetical protein|nr:MAG: hypothetical protein C4527_21980 [Candidatus Omnitrophota bacterium]
MIRVQQAPRAGEIRQSARHVLFVEGKDENAIDPKIISILLKNRIRVEAMGPSFHIHSAAEALHKYHPDYYFLIDRDHHDDDFIAKCWDRFPDPATSNLLVWRRREIENYFLIPDYLIQSEFLAVKEEKLRDIILDCCRKRIYLDAANQVIIKIREELKENWIHLFTQIEEFKTSEDAIKKLMDASEFLYFKKKVSRHLNKNIVKKHYLNILELFTGDKEKLEFNIGRWSEFVKGKSIVPTIINRCFKISDAFGKPLQGKRKIHEIIKDLVEKPIDGQPDDFKRLHNVISDRINSHG